MNSDDVRREWADRSGAYSPAYYAHHGPNETSEAVRRALERFVGRDARVLELGCSSGRHLAHLREHGFEDLAGVELNEAAFDVMAEEYPELAAEGTFHAAAIEDVVGEFPDDRFDAVYSVETLQHVHPDASWVFDELRRITSDLLITAENGIEGTDGSPGDASDLDSGGDADRDSGGNADRDAGEDADAADGPTVTRVAGEVHLYHRDWEATFAERGFRQVATAEGLRNTVRVFRTDG